MDWLFSVGQPDTAQDGYYSNGWLSIIASSHDGTNLIVTGLIDDTIDVDPGPGSFVIQADNRPMFLAAYSPGGTLIWAVEAAERIGNGSPVKPTAIDVDSAGNIYVSGIYSGTVDFNPMGSSQTISSSVDGSGFVARYNANTHTLDWVFGLGVTCGSANFAVSDLEVHQDKVIICGGYNACGTMDNVDFDPGSATTPSTAGVSNNVFFAHYDLNGNYILHAKLPQVGPNNNGTPISAHNRKHTIEVMESGSFILRGHQLQKHDVDPGTAQVITSDSSGLFFVKYSANGQYQWHGSYDMTPPYSFQSTYFNRHPMRVDQQTGDIFHAGYFFNQVDFDFGVGSTFGSTSNFLGRGYMVKYDSNGVLQFLNLFDVPIIFGEGIEFISISLQGDDICVLGGCGDSIDLDPTTPSTVYAAQEGVFYGRYDKTNGAFIHAEHINEGALYDLDFEVINDSLMYLTTHFDTTNFVYGGQSYPILENFGYYHSSLVARLSGMSCSGAPFYSITNDSTICTSDSLQLAVSGTVETVWSGGLSNGSYVLPSNDTTYFVTIYDSAGCYVNDAVNILVMEAPVVTSTVTDPLCFGSVNGEISISPLDSGLHTYNWSNGSMSQSAVQLQAGPYSVTISDTLGCDTSLTFILSEPSMIQSTVSSTSAQCFNDSTGSAAVVVSGGIPPYQYSWSDGSAMQAIQQLGGGFYFVTITDSNDCEHIDSVMVDQPQVIDITFDSAALPSSNVASDGYVHASVTGGIAPYAYAWSNGSIIDEADNLNQGTYTLTVTDDSNCVAVDSIQLLLTSVALVDENSSMTVYPNPFTDALFLEARDGIKQVHVYNSAGQLVKQIIVGSPRILRVDVAALKPGAYFMQVYDSRGINHAAHLMKL